MLSITVAAKALLRVHTVRRNVLVSSVLTFAEVFCLTSSEQTCVILPLLSKKSVSFFHSSLLTIPFGVFFLQFFIAIG